MKHPEGDRDAVGRVLAWLGELPDLTPVQWEQLEGLADWLRGEAVQAGGLGPREPGRIWTRHIADSLSFAGGWPGSPPEQLLDVGAGVGLPGIPLAILWPGTQVTLLDRSGRRVDLARRAVRRLGIGNVDVRLGDALSETESWQSAVFRAIFPPEKAWEVAHAVLRPAGRAVIGLRGTRALRPLSEGSTPGRSRRIRAIPATVLDGTVSLLIMEPSEH